jgi:hypothetical protein
MKCSKLDKKNQVIAAALRKKCNSIIQKKIEREIEMIPLSTIQVYKLQINLNSAKINTSMAILKKL